MEIGVGGVGRAHAEIFYHLQNFGVSKPTNKIGMFLCY